MNSYSLSVYRITLNKHLKKDMLENLSNFDNGKDFLSLIDMMFLSWKKDENNNNIVKDENAKKGKPIEERRSRQLDLSSSSNIY